MLLSKNVSWEKIVWEKVGEKKRGKYKTKFRDYKKK